MPRFQFSARDLHGTPVQDRIEAETSTAAVSILRARGLIVTRVFPEQSTMKWPSIPPVVFSPRSWLPIRSVDYEVSLMQVAVMLRSGITLLKALGFCAEHATHPRLRGIWANVARTIQQGSSFANALRKEKVFPRIASELAAVGEMTGTLDTTLMRAAETLEKRRHLQTSLLTALSYPSIVLLAALGVTGFLVVSVIPKFKTFLATTGRQLPPLTQAVMDSGVWLQAHWSALLIGTVALVLALAATYAWSPGRLLLDRILLHIPVLGTLIRTANTVQFARALSVLLSSGITLLEGLNHAGGLLRNSFLRRTCALARQQVTIGGSLSEALNERRAFMPLMVSLIAVGESSGALDRVLEEAARYHEMRLTAAIRQLSAVIEPIIIVIVGGLVGTVYIAFFLALFAVGGIVR